MKAFVDPVWDFYWKSALLALPMWEGGGQDTTRNYGKNQMEFEFGEDGVDKPRWQQNTIQFELGEMLYSPAPTSLGSDSNAHTAIFRVAIDAIAANGVFLMRRESSTSDWHIQYGGLRVNNTALTVPVSPSAAGWFDSKFHTHVVVVESNGDCTWYRDGSIAGTGTGVAGLDSGSGANWRLIGQGAGFFFNMKGRAGVISIHDRAFSEQEVQMITADPYGPYTYAGTTPALQPSFPQISTAGYIHPKPKPQEWNFDETLVDPSWSELLDAADFLVPFLGSAASAVNVKGKSPRHIVPTIHGGGPTLDVTNGFYGNAADFDTNPALEWHVDAQGGAAGDVLTLEFIVFPDSLSVRGFMFQGAYGGTNRTGSYVTSIETDGQVFFRTYGGGNSAATLNVQAGEWAHVFQIWRAGVEVETWINSISGGVRKEVIAVTDTSNSPITSITLGAELSGSTPNIFNEFNGKISKAAAYNRALTEQEIMRLFADPFGPVRYDDSPRAPQPSFPQVSQRTQHKFPAKPAQWSWGVK